LRPRLRNFSFLLNEVSRRYVLRFEQRAERHALTLAQCRVLVRLEGQEGISQARLGQLAGMDAMTVVRTLDRMEEQGLIERRADPADRRARCLHLTAKGKRMVEEVWRLVEATQAEVFAGVGSAQRDTFLEVLERVHANVTALGEDDLPAPRSRKKKP
jgi:DNA-binding MarR family transcriptional regulator